MSRIIRYKISLLLAIVPMVVGLLIFFIWWAMRAFCATDIYDVETTGFYWLMISLVLLVAAFVMFIISLIRRKNPQGFKKLMVLLLLTVFNFQIFKVIAKKVGQIQQYAFVKITNETGQDLKIHFHTYLKTEKALQLKQGKSKVISFIPEHIMRDERDYEITPLIFEANKRVLEIPEIDNNECRHYDLDEDFKIWIR